MKLKVLSILLLISLTGCLGPSLEKRRENFQRTMDSWRGSDINDYMRKNGYSTSSNHLPNGNIVYIFQQSATAQNPTYRTPIQTTVTPNYFGGATATTTGGQVYGGGTTTFWCNIYIETDQGGRIVYWRSEGNRCY